MSNDLSCQEGGLFTLRSHSPRAGIIF